MTNWILEIWDQLGLKIKDDPNCKSCNKKLSEHSNSNLVDCME